MPQQACLAAKAGIVILAGVVLLVGFSLRSTGRSWFYKGYDVNAASSKIRALIDRNDERIDQALESVGEAMPKLDQGLDHFVSIGRKIDEGKGTLGKLVNDPELYDSVRDAVNQIRRTFEEGEEQTVMRTFLGVFFGSVI